VRKWDEEKRKHFAGLYARLWADIETEKKDEPQKKLKPKIVAERLTEALDEALASYQAERHEGTGFVPIPMESQIQVPRPPPASSSLRTKVHSFAPPLKRARKKVTWAEAREDFYVELSAPVSNCILERTTSSMPLDQAEACA
jgi:hypothetical protein